MKKDLIDRINNILAEWDPIGVGKEMAKFEYTGYIPLIINSIHDRNLLFRHLEDIILNHIGLEYDPGNELHKKDLMNICTKLIIIFDEYNDKI